MTLKQAVLVVAMRGTAISIVVTNNLGASEDVKK